MSDSTVTKDGAAAAPQVAGSTLIVMGGLAASILFGLLRQRVVAGLFGTGAELDAYRAANGIPELLFTILAGGALSFAFLPVYTRRLGEDREAASRLFSSVLNLILLLVIAASALVGVFAPTLVAAPWGVGPGFPPLVQRLTVEVMQILLFSTILFAASSMVTGALHAHQHFWLPALTPSMYPLGIIIGGLTLSPSMGVAGLAWGAVIGAGLHLAVQLPGLFIYKIQWRPLISLGDPALARVATLMAPRIVDLMMARIMIDWINANIGSRLGEGRLSALGFAFTLMNMPWTLIGTAIGIAVFPTLAILAAADRAREREALTGALRAVLSLALPAALALILLGRQAIQVLFEGGAFTAESTELVYFALQFYALALISQCLLEIVVRAFAAQEDTLTPLIVSLFTTAINVGLAIWLARPERLAHGGLPLANGIAVGIESIAGLTIIALRWGLIDLRATGFDLLRILAASALMGGVIWLLDTLLGLGPLPALLVYAGAGGLVYLGAAWLLGLREVIDLPVALLRRYLPGRAAA